MVWARLACLSLKLQGQQLTKIGEKENYKHLPVLSTVTNINSCKSALSNVDSLVSVMQSKITFLLMSIVVS